MVPEVTAVDVSLVSRDVRSDDEWNPPDQVKSNLLPSNGYTTTDSHGLACVLAGLVAVPVRAERSGLVSGTGSVPVVFSLLSRSCQITTNNE